MKLLLSPHPDDETLFGAYTLLEHHPLVIVCTTGAARHGSAERRLSETGQAMRLLGCDWLPPPEGDLEEALGWYDPSHVWAPLPETDGNSEHNMVGELAVKLWPGKVTWYTTYNDEGRTTLGEQVAKRDGWESLKVRALACYQSQLDHPGTRPHFERGLDEYVLEPQAVPA